MALNLFQSTQVEGTRHDADSPCSPSLRRSRHAQRDAFTLLEVLVAVTILGVAISGTLAAFSVSIRAASRSLRLEQAVDIAQRELALYASLPADQLQPREGTAGVFAWQVQLADGPHGLVHAVVTVRWTHQGQLQVVRLAQLLSPRQQQEA